MLSADLSLRLILFLTTALPNFLVTVRPIKISGEGVERSSVGDASMIKLLVTHFLPCLEMCIKSALRFKDIMRKVSCDPYYDENLIPFCRLQ